MIYTLWATKNAKETLSTKIDMIFQKINEKNPILIPAIKRFLEDIERLSNGIEKRVKNTLIVISNKLDNLTSSSGNSVDDVNLHDLISILESLVSIEPKTNVEKQFFMKFHTKITKMINCLNSFYCSIDQMHPSDFNCNVMPLSRAVIRGIVHEDK